MSMVDDILHGVGTGPNLRDFQHANKIFVGDSYALSPKYSFLFHVSFDIENSVTRLPNLEKLQLGMLVKSVQLPKYTIEAKTMNAYNRPNIVQSKIKYDPITITFHDDSSDVVRDFWYDYMSHYYRDSDYSPALYDQPTKYNIQRTEHWGYQPAKYITGTNERILKNIKIYSLHQKRFTEYILVNPTITGFQHGQHTQGQNEFLENSMTLSYETVLYNYGTVLPNAAGSDQEPSGFAQLSYDKTPSPLTPQGGGTSSILGPGGLLSAATGITNTLSQGANPLSIFQAGVTGLRAYNNIKGQNLLGMAGAELKTIGLGILKGDTNTLNRLALPKAQANYGTNSKVQAAE